MEKRKLLRCKHKILDVGLEMPMSNPMSTPTDRRWAHLRPRLQLTEYLKLYKLIVAVGGVLKYIPYGRGPFHTSDASW